MRLSECISSFLDSPQALKMTRCEFIDKSHYLYFALLLIFQFLFYINTEARVDNPIIIF